MNKLANYIRCIRLQKGLSQENMAYDLNISITAYSKIERGLTNISFSRLEQIALCLGVTMTSLIDYYENGNNNQIIVTNEKTNSSYVSISEYNESTLSFIQSRINDLEENMKTLRQAIIDVRSFLQRMDK